MLYPSPRYPFAPDVPVLRGSVRDSAGASVPDALVSQAILEQMGENGSSYALSILAEAVGALAEWMDRRALATLLTSRPVVFGLSSKSMAVRPWRNWPRVMPARSLLPCRRRTTHGRT